jgi:DNA-binding NarL/FixJ family response regulator
LEERLGRLDAARQRAADAVEISRIIGSGETLAMARGIDMRSMLWQRGPAPASALAELLKAEGRSRSEWNAELADAFIATVHLHAEDLAACVRHVELRSGAVFPPTALYAAQAVASLAVAKARLGAYDEAVDLARQALAAADRLGLNFHLGSARHAYAQVLLHGEHHAAAIEAADAAARNFRELGAPVHEALARQTMAEAFAAAGDLPRARLELGAAKGAFAAASAHWLTAQATRAETRLGALSPRQGRPELPGILNVLSTREGEVATLVVAGLTNREIAKRLYLSPKTVETHLGRVFSKLGVRSRAAVAAMLSAQPTQPPPLPIELQGR